MRKIIFKLHLAAGDALMFTCGVRDFKLLFPEILINVDTNFPSLFKNNPHITHIDPREPGVEKYTLSNVNVQASNGTINHMCFSFLFDMISQAGLYESLPISLPEFTAAFASGRVGDKDEQLKHQSVRDKFSKLGKLGFLKQKADLHLDSSDKVNIIKNNYGVENYWVIANGGKHDCEAKIWDWRKFQRVIDYYDGKIKFVTIGMSSHILYKLNNVIDLTDKTKDIRELFPIVYNASGCVSGISFLMHLAAGLNKPCVSIYGGREPVSYTFYNSHQILHTQSVLNCCDNNSGCWTSDVEQTKRKRCKNIIDVDDKKVQKCMSLITSDDVIRAIGKYYDGNKLSYSENIEKPQINTNIDIPRSNSKTINILASIKGKGGGEKSAIEIGRVLENAGWQVNFVPIGSIHPNYEGKFKYQTEIYPNSPLLFYGNDNVDWFCDNPQIYEKASDIIIGINFITGKLKNCRHLANDKRLKAILFQNNDALNMFKKQSIGFENVPLDISVGAISLDKFIQIPVNERLDNDKLIIVKTSVADWRKYVTTESERKGEKKFIYQKHIFAEKDIVFYNRLIKDLGNKVEFRFMEAHSEIVNHFKDNQQFKFYKFDEIPIDQFLRQGHIFLQRTSMLWDDSYPRSIAEAMAAGLPVICEPRYGPRDRIIHGRTGLYFIDYDSCALDIKLLLRKEGMRRDMGKECKIYARDNFDSRNWVKVINKYLNGGNKE